MRARTGLIREITVGWAFVERNFTLTRRYIGWEIVFLVYSAVNALTIGLIGVSHGRESVLYLVVGALLWGYLSLLFHEVAESISWERWEGTIEYTFMAPVSRLTHMLGTCMFAALYGVLRSVVIVVLLALFLDLDLAAANIPAAVFALVVSSFSFIGLGLIAAVLPLMSPEKGSQGTHIIQSLILLVSGVYYEIEVLPAWVQPFSFLSPATYTLRAIRETMLHGAGLTDIWPTLAGLAVTGAFLIPAGLAVFLFAESWAKRNGKLKRTG